MASEHDPRVARFEDWDRPRIAPIFVASCECGWEGPERANSHAADEDSEAHSEQTKQDPATAPRTDAER